MLSGRVLKVLSIVMSFSFSLIFLSSCSKEQTRSTRSNRDKHEETSYEETEQSVETNETTQPPTPTNKPSPTPTPGVVFSDIDVYHYIGAFSEGYAWIAYYEYSNDYSYVIDSTITQLVDKKGNVYFEYETDNYAPTYMSLVKNGLTWIRLTDTEYHSDWKDGCVEWIIDTKGNVSYKTKQEDSSSKSVREHIIGAGNGKFLVLKCTSDMDGEKYYLGTIDKYGKVVDEYWEAFELQLSKDQTAEYLQDDYYSFGNFIYDMANQISIENYIEHDDLSVPGYNSFDGIYYGGEFPTCSFTDTRPYTDKDYGVWASDYAEAGVHISAADYELEDPGIDYPVDGWAGEANDLYGPHRQISDWFYLWHGFYDGHGKRVMDIEVHENLFMWCSPFDKDGYAMMIVKGADGYHYITVIDKSGEEQFEPFRILYYSNPFNQDLCNFSPYLVNGRFVCQTGDGLCLFDKQGKQIKVLASDYTDMSDPYNDFNELYVEEFDEDYVIARHNVSNSYVYGYIFF